MKEQHDSPKIYLKECIEVVGKFVTPLLCAPFECDNKQPIGNILRVDIMPIAETKKRNCVPEQDYSTLTIKLNFRKLIKNSC